MTINDEISILANQLANVGKKPTVALIKNKLNKKVPLPTIISVLKTWQHEPSFISKPKEINDIKQKDKVANATGETEIFRQNLNDELAQMKQEIIELKHLVKQLIEQQQN
jgi:hypothetical protein